VTNEGLSGIGLGILDRLTDVFPTKVPRIFQSLFLRTVGSPIVDRWIFKMHQRRLRKVPSFERLLVVADVGIGDALIVQRSLSVLRSLFPSSRIDYVCSKTAGEILLSLPAADHVYPLFDRHGTPSGQSYRAIWELLDAVEYSALLNLSPFLDSRIFRASVPVLDIYIPLASQIVRLWRTPGEKRHISIAVPQFFEKFFSSVSVRQPALAAGDHFPAPGGEVLAGNVVYIPEASIDAAEEFLMRKGLGSLNGIVFFSPDATSVYSMIPFTMQVELLRSLAENDMVASILVGAAYAQKGIEHRLMDALPARLRNRVIIVPHIPLPEYAALLDASEVFLSGDGGPSHVAAAWKQSCEGMRTLRNRTAVFTVFGGTDSRMYGYDSYRDDYVAASQRAPSRVFDAPAPCRNITCVDKLGKSCREVRCFAGLRTESVSRAVSEYLASLSRMRHSA